MENSKTENLITEINTKLRLLKRNKLNCLHKTKV